MNYDWDSLHIAQSVHSVVRNLGFSPEDWHRKWEWCSSQNRNSDSLLRVSETEIRGRKWKARYQRLCVYSCTRLDKPEFLVLVWIGIDSQEIRALPYVTSTICLYFHPSQPRSSKLIYCLSVSFGYFLTVPLLSGRHIWKPLYATCFS